MAMAAETETETETEMETSTATNSVADSIMTETRRRARDQKRLLEIHHKDIVRMDRQAESIYLTSA